MDTSPERKSPVKVPPHSIEAEAAFLSGILTHKDAFDGVTLTEDHFYHPQHRIIFSGIRDLYQRLHPHDHITVQDYLQQRGTAKEVLLSLGKLTHEVTPEKIEEYEKIILDRALLRRLIDVSTEIREQAYASPFAEETIAAAEASIYEIATKHIPGGASQIGELAMESIKHIEERKAAGKEIRGIPTGFRGIDYMLSGLCNSDLYILGARPAMGKSAIALQLAGRVAELGYPVVFYSLEMSREQLTERLISVYSNVPLGRIRSGKLEDGDYNKIGNVAAKLYNMPLYIDDYNYLTPSVLRSRVRRMKREKNIVFIVVDYLQLMHGDGNYRGQRTQEVGDIAQSLKGLAGEMDVPVMALSSLNRSLESRSDKRPVMSDLRECVTGDTLVSLANGTAVPIESLVGLSPYVYSLDSLGKIVVAQAKAVWRAGKKDVFLIKTKSGREIKATAKHRFLGPLGWREVGNFLAGDRIALPRTMPEAGSGLSWDSVLSVEPQGQMETFDMEVPETSCWIANGIISHNSGGVEHSSDSILFLYRDTVYHSEADPNIAELIVAKQRNGPTGTIKLRFQSECVRFENDFGGL